MLKKKKQPSSILLPSPQTLSRAQNNPSGSSYSVSNSSWTPGETARFLATPPAPTFRPNVLATPPQNQVAAAPAAPAALRWQDFVSKGDTTGAMKSNAMYRMARAQSNQANMMNAKSKAQDVGQQIALRTLSGQNQLANTELAGQNQQENTAVVGQNMLAGTRLSGKNRFHELKLTGENAIATTNLVGQNRLDVAGLNNAGAAERNRLSAAVTLIGQGVPGAAVQDLANTAPPFSAHLAGIQIPSKPAPGVNSVFVKPQFDNSNNLRPGTGVWEAPPTQAAGSQSISDRIIAGKVDKNNLSADDETELWNLSKTDPKSFQKLLARLNVKVQ